MSTSRPEPVFATCTGGDFEDFRAAVRRGFHGDLEPDPDRPAAWFEPDRAFGFRVGERWVATCGALSRQLTVPGGAGVDVAAVTMVTVAPDQRRRGLLNRMMTHQLADIAERGEPLAALWAAEVPIYGRYGYGNATRRLQLSGHTPAPFRASFGLGPGWCEQVDRDRFLELVPSLHASLLSARIGALTRPAAWWERMLYDPPGDRDGASARRLVVHFDADCRPDGYASFRVAGRWAAGDVADSELQVEELDAGDDSAYAALWRFLLDLDLVRSYVMNDASVDEPLLHLLADQRSVSARINDALYVRLVDVPAALAARTYASEVDLVLSVRDQRLATNDGRFRLRSDADGRAEVSATTREPDLSLDVAELGAVYLGGICPSALARAGLIAEHRAGTLARADRAFAGDRAPFCPDHF